MFLDILIILATSLFVFFVLIARPRREKLQDVPVAWVPENAIVVDGSNVMHWGGEASADVLARVLHSLENKGYTPIVFFDASAGYKLGDRYYNEAKMAALIGIPARYICVVDKGVVADEMILTLATEHGLRIVTNDQFRDWRMRFPHAAKKGTLVRGAWREGAVIWRGKF